MNGFILFFNIDVSKQETIKSNTTNLAIYKSRYCNVNIVLKISGQYKLPIYLMPTLIILFQTKLLVNSIVSCGLKLLAF